MKNKKLRKKSCESKVPHETEADARLAIRKTLQTNFIFHRLEAYKCKFCGKWHIGKTRKVVYSRFKRLKGG